MADTPNHEYNVPNQGDQDWHQPLNENFEDFEVDIELRDQEANLSNYTPTDGAKFLATDTGVVYLGDGNNWVPTFLVATYDDANDEAQFGSTIVASQAQLGILKGPVTNGTAVSNIAGNNLSIDSNGQLNASTGGGGGGGNWTENNNLLEPTDSSVDGIDVDETNTVSLSGPVTGGQTLSSIIGNNLSIDSNGQLNASTGSGGGISNLSGGEGIDPGSINDGDTLSVAWGDANDLDSDGNVTSGGGSGGNWTENNNLLEPTDSSINGINVTEVRATQIAAENNPLNLTVSGNRALELHPESGGESGSVVAGHSSNSANGVSGATIAGGGANNQPNETSGKFGTISGGVDNFAGGLAAVIGGGISNRTGQTQSLHGTISGGQDNELFAERGVIGGGRGNRVGIDNNSRTPGYATVGGGQDNRATGTHATVSGGENNEASGSYASVAGGRDNTASASDSFAVGRNATASEDGSFVVGDSTSDEVSALRPDEARFQGALRSNNLKTEAGLWYYPGTTATTAQWRTRYDASNNYWRVDEWNGFTWGERMWVTSNGDVKAAGSKDFVETVDTDDGEKEVHYTATESGTPTTEASGVGELDDGRAEIELPDHFDMVTSDDEPLVIQTTPYGGSAGLKVVERSTDRLVVEDLDGEGDYEFAYTVKGTREGYEDKQVVREPTATADQSQTPSPADD